MVTQIQLPVLLSMLPKAGKLIQAEADRPSMHQALAAEQMRDLLRQEREQVSELKKPQETLQVRPDDERERERNDQQAHREQKPREEQEEVTGHVDPWSGQIINIKV
jgi:uncharacterized protein YlxW (UPF0749 family)